jgi:hypothetical protein
MLLFDPMAIGCLASSSSMKVSMADFGSWETARTLRPFSS